jgi:hypothetical protein
MGTQKSVIEGRKNYLWKKYILIIVFHNCLKMNVKKALDKITNIML